MDNNNNFPQNGGYPFEPSKPFTDNTNPQNPILHNQEIQNTNEVDEYITSESPRIEPTPEELPEIDADDDYIYPGQTPQPTDFDNEGINYAFPQAQQPQQGAPYGYHPTQNIPPQQRGFNQPYQRPAHQSDYSHPVYRTNTPPQGNFQNYPPHNPNVPPQVYAYPYPNGGQVSNPPFTTTPPKKGASTGLVIVLTVIVMLLIGSVAGMIIYTASNKQNDNVPDNNNSFGITLPEETKPQEEESTTAPSNEKSDYSDKTDSNYKGLELLSKPKDSTKNSKYTSEYAFNRVSQSVVGIVCYTDKITNVENCDSQGTGIIITEDGYVVTNSHVISNSKTAYKIQVIMDDGTTYNAGVVGFDSRTDIAVLKIDNAKNLKPATFGNSEEIELGEDIIVVGNPGGIDYQNSITKGVVSAVNRKLSSSSLVKYIQTDAAINPGNSGGPIVNMYGQVIGIATSKIVSEYYENMGFAIPSSTTKDIVDSLMKNGYVNGRVKIGISGYDISSKEAEMYGIPQGIIVDEIVADGPCDGTSLQKEDIITEADGTEITSFSDIYEVLEKHKAGDKIKIKYYRQSDKNTYEIEVTLQADK